MPDGRAVRCRFGFLRNGGRSPPHLPRETRDAATAAEVAALVTAFVDRWRIPRLEYLPKPAPGLEERLLRGTVRRGGTVALARDSATGLGVGDGLCAPPHAGVSELAAVGVRAAYRRRGIAAALTVLLTRACPAVGITTPFLTPAGPAEERVYRSAGYLEVASMLHISR